MTTRERFLRTMNLVSVDRPPNFELGYWGQTTDRWLNEGMPDEALTQVHPGGPFYGHEFFGIERRDYIPINLGAMPPFQPETIEETDRYIIYCDGNGILRKALKEGTVRGTRPSMDQYLRFPVTTRADFEAIKRRYDPASPERLPANWLDAYQPPQERTAPLCLVPNGAFGLYSHLRRWMGTEGLSYAFYDDPTLVNEMLDYLVEFFVAVTEKVLNVAQVDYFNFFEDFAFKTGPLISPSIFRKFFMPRYRRIIEFLHSHGIRIIWLDSDGNFEALLPMLVEIGVTCIWPLEQAAGMDPHKLRRQYGRDLCLSGGLDKREIAKDKTAIEREVMSKVPELVAQGGYIPTLDHTFPPDISYDSFRYYLDIKLKAMEQG
ncbi:MAG TPA: hypothetical protein EYP10_09765 [Armatimonadetes bacterium]|nr:hypothetical protein [Armatimonadota bacterium]